MTLEQLCKGIKLNQGVIEAVLETQKNLTIDEAWIEKLTHIETAENANTEVKKVFGEDTNRMKILSVQLLAAVKVHDRYVEQGISDEIYYATMACFSRFIEERYRAHQEYLFDRDWWSYRQTSFVLFRVGLLEYEFVEEKGEKSVHIHIPSDVRLQSELVDESIQQFDDFEKKHFPEYVSAPITCGSWLLYPGLSAVLSPSSNILAFQHRFDIKRTIEESTSCLYWVYGRRDIEYSKLPENTSLRKNLKAYYLSGKHMGEGFGVLRK
jgi:hypothetical protein